MIHDEPDCFHDKLTPCTAGDWIQCDLCARVVCMRHDDLYEVLRSGELAYYKVDRLCAPCVEEGWERGELIRGEGAQYINRR